MFMSGRRDGRKGPLMEDQPHQIILTLYLIIIKLNGILSVHFYFRFNPPVSKCSMSVKLVQIPNHEITRASNGLH